MSAPQKYYVTTPIYYVNDAPHIGHAYTTILADVLARYYRLLDVPTFFLTGTDEHGQKVDEAARKNGMTPQEQCDATVVRFQSLWSRLEITNDDFIRTTEPRHKRVVGQILQDLYDRDEIYAADYEGSYCVPCERFFTDKDLVDGQCPECRRAVNKLVEHNYFFRMGKYQEWLIDHINRNPEFIQPEHRRRETLGFLRQPLGDLCVSRPKSRLNWGIELPFDQDFVTYVWFDALVNYISAVGYLKDDAAFAAWWPASCHLIGKDILTTHTVYWPTMLKAMGLEMPKSIFAHGWWLTGRDKMSKSLGNVVNPMDMIDKYGVDAFRYFLLAEMSLGQDASFTEPAFVLRYNADLANDLGNLASRVVKMLLRDPAAAIPPVPEATEDDLELRQATLGAVRSMRSALLNMQLDRGIADVLGAVRAANRYFEKMQPWVLAKQEDPAPLQRVLYNSAECLRIVAGLLYPVMPEKMRSLRQAIGMPADRLSPHFADLDTWGKLPPGAKVADVNSLFPRVETEKSAEKTAKAAGGKTKTGKTPVPAAENVAIGIEDFGKVALRTARILAAEPVDGADRLLRLQLDLGGETRQIVAGIAHFYRPEEIVGKTVVVVANLKPATIRGVESHGMLLAAKQGKELKIVTVDGDLPPGAAVG